MNKKFWRNTILSGFGALAMVTGGSGCEAVRAGCIELGNTFNAAGYAFESGGNMMASAGYMGDETGQAAMGTANMVYNVHKSLHWHGSDSQYYHVEYEGY